MKGILLLLAMHISICSMAKTVSQEKAMSKALRFVQPAALTRGISKAEAPRLTLAYTAAEGDEIYYYVFNNASGGYVIVGGDDVAHDVLAYGESGAFDYDRMPPAMKWWLGQYEGQIHRAIQTERGGTEPRVQHRSEVQPLLGNTAWDQDIPYSAHILNNVQLYEADSDDYYPTGCVATALAQIMRYWRYPQHGMASHAYKYNGNIFEADFSKADYKWDLMQDWYYLSYSNQPEEDAVAELLYHLGIGLNMIYDVRMGIAQPEMVAYTLRTFFGYSGDARKLSRNDGYADDEWEDIVYQELAAGRPIVYGGGGHAFVCDGYRDGFYHINWGWRGDYNDYYLLTSTDGAPVLAPDHRHYDSQQQIIIGIQPDYESEGFVHTTGILDIPEEVSSAPLHVETSLCNPTSQDIEIKPVLELYDDDADVYSYIDYHKDTEVIPARETVTIGFTIPHDLLTEGHDYYVFIDDKTTTAKFTYTFFHAADAPTGITRQKVYAETHGSRTYNLYGIPVGEGYKGIVIEKDGRVYNIKGGRMK